MSWRDQGRQYHMWFGHGTAAGKGGEDIDPSVTGKSAAQRANAIAFGTIGALPRAQRQSAEAQLHYGTLSDLTKAMEAWIRGNHLSPAGFAEKFFGPGADQAVVQKLHGAAVDAGMATNHADLRNVSIKVAEAILAVGIGQWPRFLAKVQVRARDDIDASLGAAKPVPFVDDRGQAILDADGKPMMRPAGMDPHFFVSQGIKDRQAEGSLISQGNAGGAAAAVGYEIGALSKFGRFGPWDAQRIGGIFHPEFVDYATVAIGLYAAANGIPRDQILSIEDAVARTSHYPSTKEMSQAYPHLPDINVKNTDLGYSLYQSGRIGVTAP